MGLVQYYVKLIPDVASIVRSIIKYLTGKEFRFNGVQRNIARFKS